MGNCLFAGEDSREVVKVVTSDGGVMEFYAPITAESITDEFPGHGIFRSHDLFWKPLANHQLLVSGESYSLLPLNDKRGTAQLGHVRSNSVPQTVVSAPYRMSFDSRRIKLKRSPTEVVSRCGYGGGGGGGGFWKVKLVITPEQLLEILSQENRTQDLIESVRTVAKCGSGGGGGGGVASSLSFSDQWSLSSSSRNASSQKDGFLEL